MPTARASQSKPTTLVWFRDDLRLADNPALAAAVEKGGPVVCLFVLEDDSPDLRPLGAAARFWLHHSLSALQGDLARLGQTLVLKRGPAVKAVPALASKARAKVVLWNRRYGPPERIDAEVETRLKGRGIASETFAANLLFEPHEVHNKSGGAFRVFSAFRQAAARQSPSRAPLPRPKAIPALDRDLGGVTLESLALTPTAPDWSAGIREAWRPGEAGAREQLDAFADAGASAYDARRDFPGADATARLSPHLRFGEISPFQVQARVAMARHRCRRGKVPLRNHVARICLSRARRLSRRWRPRI